MLAVFGGLIGGLFGGAAVASNTALARSRVPVAVKAVSMTCIAVLAVVAYFNFAFAVRAWLSPSSSQPAATPQLGLPQPTAPAQLGLPQPTATQRPASCTSADPATPTAPAQTRPAGVDPVTVPAHSGVTSAHADEVSFRVSRGESADYAGPAVRFSGSDDWVQVNAGQRLIDLWPRLGEAFTCGTYHDTPSDDPGGAARPLISGPGLLGCGTEASTLTIYQFAFGSDGTLTRLNATFSQICDNSPGPLVGLIRYNATIPTPVLVLPASPGT